MENKYNLITFTRGNDSVLPDVNIGKEYNKEELDLLFNKAEERYAGFDDSVITYKINKSVLSFQCNSLMDNWYKKLKEKT